MKIEDLPVADLLALKMPPPCEVDQNRKDGDHVRPMTVLHAPGHTPGSFTFQWPERKHCQRETIITTWPEFGLGWPPITLDNRQNRDSVGITCDMTDAEVPCVGHGDPITTGADKFMRSLVATAGKA